MITPQVCKSEMSVMSPTTLMTFICLAVVALYVIGRRYQRRRNGQPLPGPKGIPLFGNINELPKTGDVEWQHWLQYKDRYGPISSLTIMGQTLVIINDLKIAYDLMRDRSIIYSSRPGLVFSTEIVGWKHATGILPYNETWKTHRKNVTKLASTSVSIKVFDKVQEAESAHFLLNVLESPDALFDHIRKEAGTVILKIIYGYNAESHGRDPFVDLASTCMQEFAEASVPGKWMVDVIPFLKYIPEGVPGSAFKTTGRRMAKTLERCVEQPYEFVKQQIRVGKHRTSFLSQAIETIGSDAKMEFIHKWSAMSMFAAGADTTVSSLMTYFLAMSVFPEVQKKAQRELDRVIGSGRLPVAADRDSLPYIMAIMKETHRWHPVAPLGLPHSSDEEDIYQGYRIPKGSILLSNNWWFAHDPAVYPDPMTFNPDRFLDSPIHKAERDPRDFIFGFGRRICPGRYIADNALFITIAQSLAVFSIEKLVENGKVVEPEIRFEPGTISHPVPYRISIKPRSEMHEDLIKKVEQDYPWEESDAQELGNMKW